MAIDSGLARSRRALLLGSLGAVAAAAAQAVARPLGAKAASDSVAYTNDENNDTVLSASSFANGPGTGQGIGVHGHSATNIGVRGTSDTNVAVRGDSKSGYGMWAESQTFHALGAYSKTHVGVWGTSESNYGVRGDSVNGRGGLFIGKRAQLRLRPSDASSHPSSGAMGDLFVDRHGRLWFCKGGRSWRLLA